MEEEQNIYKPINSAPPFASKEKYEESPDLVREERLKWIETYWKGVSSVFQTSPYQSPIVPLSVNQKAEDSPQIVGSNGVSIDLFLNGIKIELLGPLEELALRIWSAEGFKDKNPPLILAALDRGVIACSKDWIEKDPFSLIAIAHEIGHFHDPLVDELVISQYSIMDQAAKEKVPAKKLSFLVELMNLSLIIESRAWHNAIRLASIMGINLDIFSEIAEKYYQTYLFIFQKTIGEVLDANKDDEPILGGRVVSVYTDINLKRETTTIKKIPTMKIGGKWERRAGASSTLE